MRAYADERRLLPSGGTDYHGHDDMTYADALASTHVPDVVGELVLDRLGR